MLNKVRNGLTDAISQGKEYRGYEVRYCPKAQCVTLYGRPIARQEGAGWWMTCGGWNTNRTRQLLNALCQHLAGRQVLECHNLVLFADGVQIGPETWFPVEARTKESPH